MKKKIEKPKQNLLIKMIVGKKAPLKFFYLETANWP